MCFFSSRKQQHTFSNTGRYLVFALFSIFSSFSLASGMKGRLINISMSSIRPSEYMLTLKENSMCVTHSRICEHSWHRYKCFIHDAFFNVFPMKSVLLGYIIQDCFGLHQFHAIDFHQRNLLKQENSLCKAQRTGGTTPITALGYCLDSISDSNPTHLESHLGLSSPRQINAMSS